MRFEILILASFFTTSLMAKPMIVQSHWKTGEIVIDGVASEWSDPFTELSDNEDWSLNVKNDNDNLYLSFISSDRSINHQIMMSGFAITFNGKQKSKDVIFGVRFPIGMQSNEQHFRNSPNRDPEVFKAIEEQMFQSLEIIGPTKNDTKPMGVGIADSFGIKVKCTHAEDSLVYELEIPLKKGTDITGEIELAKKSFAKVTFETIRPDFSSEKMNGDREGHALGGANTSRGNGMGGIMGGGGTSDGPPSGRAHGRKLDFSSYFKSELMIKLASNPLTK